MRKEYDLRQGGTKNPYAARIGSPGRAVLLDRFLRTQNYVRLDEDVADAFPDEAAVNEALRLVLRAKALATPERKTTVRGRRRKSA